MYFSKKSFLPVAMSALLSISLTACFHDDDDDDHDHVHGGDITLTLDADEVVSGALDTGETATATLLVHEDDEELTGSVMFTGSSTVTALHLHSGYAGQTGGAVITFEQDATNDMMWNIPSDSTTGDTAGDLDLATLQAGGYYLNAHYANGTLRAQVITEDHIEIRVAALMPHTDVTTSGAGFAGVTINTETNDVIAHVTINELDDLTSALNTDTGDDGVHLHITDADNTDDSSKFNLLAAGTATTGKETYSYDSTASVDNAGLAGNDRANIALNQWYINVHTVDNLPGELRADFTAITNP